MEMALGLFSCILIYNPLNKDVSSIKLHCRGQTRRSDGSSLKITSIVTFSGYLIEVLVVMFGYFHMSRVMRKPTFWFPTWSDTNRAVQPQKMARDLKFRI